MLRAECAGGEVRSEEAGRQAPAGHIGPFKAVKDLGAYGFQHVLGAGNTVGNRLAGLHG